MASGAGHDAAYIARAAPTTMIFVPCLGGLSHNEEESTSFEECSAGAQVLLERGARIRSPQERLTSKAAGELRPS